MSYLIRRILISIPKLLAISAVIFVLALAPEDPMAEFATNPVITAEVRKNIRRSLGWDQPLPFRHVMAPVAATLAGYLFVSPDRA